MSHNSSLNLTRYVGASRLVAGRLALPEAFKENGLGGIIGRHKLSEVVADNEATLMKVMDSGNYIQVFLVAHTLIESYLREFLSEKEEETKFSSLVSKYQKFLKSISYTVPTFVTELTELNCRRNRIIH